jgi:uncharacterized coiled-coil DUF342 family protein
MMDEDFLVTLENAKTTLIEVSERALGPTKEAILPLQTAEAKDIKERLRHFVVKVAEYRYEFQTNCPYHVSSSSPETIQAAYEKITDYYNKTNELEIEAKGLNDQETLFDMQKSTYKQLKECRVEL